MKKSTMNKALFLDRDGVINVERDYVHRTEDFEFIDGIFELCLLAQNLNFKLLVITNQAGIGRGYYAETDFAKLTDWMLNQFAVHEIHIERVYHCPFHPTAGIGKYRKDSFDRKPNPGMILKAKEDFCLDLSNSVLLGDKDSDIGAGRNAGVRYNLKLIRETDATPQSADELEFTSLYAVQGWLRHAFS